MKAGVSCYCFNQMLTAGEITLMDVIEFVGRETEAECIEPLTRFWDQDRDENEQAKAARKQLDEVGLQVSCYTLDSDFAVYDEAGNRACIDRCKARLETALILGTDTIRLDPRSALPTGRTETVDADQVLTRVAAGMAEVAEAAAGKGIKVGVENHGSMLGRVDQVARMVELVGLPNFGVNLDFTNFRNVYGEDHVQATRQLARHVVHVHAKDFHITREPQEGDQWRQIPTGQYVKRAIGGEGDAQWAEVFSILKEAGYDGTISLEVSDPADIRGSVAKGVANVKRIIGEVEGRE